jgi:hypothetical protein
VFFELITFSSGWRRAWSAVFWAVGYQADGLLTELPGGCFLFGTENRQYAEMGAF